MEKLGKGVVLLLLLAAWVAPGEIAAATVIHSASNSAVHVVHKVTDDEDEEDEEDSDDDKQFVPPPLVVKHKSSSSTSTSVKTTTSAKKKKTSKTTSASSPETTAVIAPLAIGVVPSSAQTLLQAVSLNIISQEQAFSTNDYETTPIIPESKGTQPAPTIAPPTNHPIPSSDAVDPTLNPPVINNMSAAHYEDPATEFMHKAYFGLAVLGSAAIAMVVHTVSRSRKQIKVNQSDYEYENQSDL